MTTKRTVTNTEVLDDTTVAEEERAAHDPGSESETDAHHGRHDPYLRELTEAVSIPLIVNSAGAHLPLDRLCGRLRIIVSDCDGRDAVTPSANAH